MHSTHRLTEPQLLVTRRGTMQPRRWLVPAGKCVISSVLILWLLKDTSLHDITQAMQSSYIPMIILAFSLHFIGCFLSVLRWRVLLQAQNITISLPFLFKSYMVAIFFNNLLPSTIGGDVMRIHDTCRIGGNKSGAVTAVFVDRLLGVFVLMGFVFFSLLVSGRFSIFPAYIYIWTTITISLLLIISVVFFFYKENISQYFRSFNIYVIKNIGEILIKFAENLAIFKGNKINFFTATLLSILLQINVVLYYFLIAYGIGIGVSVSEFFLIVPTAIFVMMIPISINGIGLRENIFVFMMSFYNIPQYSSVAMAWIDYGMIILLGSLGGIVYIIRK